MTFVNKNFICRHWGYLLVIGALEDDILKIELILEYFIHYSLMSYDNISLTYSWVFIFEFIR